MTQDLLHHPEVRAAFEKMSGGTVTQSVGREVGGIRERRHGLVHNAADLPLIYPPPAFAEKERLTGGRSREIGTPVANPPVDCVGRGSPVRDGAFLVALPDHAEDASFGVDIVEVDGTQLTDPYAGCVQQFQDRVVPEGDGVEFTCTRFGRLQEFDRLIVPEDCG